MIEHFEYLIRIETALIAARVEGFSNTEKALQQMLSSVREAASKEAVDRAAHAQN
ncbi:hypothetical protein [Rhodophyticola porphyridii]|nr:hypothetical protein [Rhodophyticola porphyridii]